MSRMRLNPVTDLVRFTGRSAGSVARPFRPLMTPRSPEFYMEKMKGVPFNLQILIGEDESYEDDEDYISLRDRAQDLAEQTGHHVAIIDINAAFASAGDEERGHPNRVSPYTPFTVLHRIFDSLLVGSGPSLSYVLAPDCGLVYDQFDEAVGGVEMKTYELTNKLVHPLRLYEGGSIRRDVARRLTSAGVGTAAGRMHAFDDPEQVAADLFALKALTGRWGYDPSALPDMSGMPYELKSWPPELLQSRKDLNAAARKFIYCLVEGLRYSPPQVFEI